MAISEVDRHLSRLSDLKRLRSPLEDDWNAIDELVFRRRSRFGNTTSRETYSRRLKGQRGDNTAGKGIDNLISGLESLMFGRAPYRVIPADDGERGSEPAQIIGDRLSERLNRALFNERAGFAPVRRKIFGGAAGFGTAGMITGIDMQEKALVFQHLPLPQTYIAEDHRGRVTTIYREFTLTAEQAVEWFRDGASSDVKRDMERQPDKRRVYVMAVEPAQNVTALPGSPKPSAVTYLDVGSNRVVQRGMWARMRAHIVRWETLEDSPYGWCPVLTILDEIKGTNKQVVSNLQAAHQMIRPQVYQAGGHGFNEVGRTPNSVINYAPSVVGGELKFERFPGPENLPISLEMQQASQGSIREGLYAHLLNVPIGPEMTATEFLGRLQEIVRAIGPSIGRFIAEWAQPAAASAMDLLASDHAFDDILAGSPYEGLPMAFWHVDFQSPVDRARDQDDAQSVTQMLQFTAAVAGVDPIAVQGFDADEAQHYVRRKIGAPAAILKSRDAMLQIRNTIAQQQALQQAIQTAGAAGAAGNELAALDQNAGLAGAAGFAGTQA